MTLKKTCSGISLRKQAKGQTKVRFLAYKKKTGHDHSAIKKHQPFAVKSAYIAAGSICLLAPTYQKTGGTFQMQIALHQSRLCRQWRLSAKKNAT